MTRSLPTRSLPVLVGTGALLAVLSACGSTTSAGPDFTAPTFSTPSSLDSGPSTPTSDPASDSASNSADDTDAAPDFYQAADLQAATKALSTAIGAQDPSVVELAVYPTYVIIQAVDPKKPTHLNEWTYRDGTVGRSQPLDYGGDVKALHQNLFSLSEVTPAAVAGFYTSALAMSHIKGAKLDSLVVQRAIPLTTDVEMSAPVTSARDSKTVTGDVHGKVIKVS